MRSSLDTTTRWCPVCESRGIPIIWGEPSEHIMRLAEEGRVILAGCTPLGIHPSHACNACEVEFIASDRVYRRGFLGTHLIGIGVWPHGRRSVRIEDNEAGWTVVVAGEGSMLIDRDALPVFIRGVFDGMSPWEVDEWIARRGFDVEVRRNDDDWEVRVSDAQLFELILIKTWWRSLGPNPVEKVIERLSSEGSAPVWLPIW